MVFNFLNKKKFGIFLTAVIFFLPNLSFAADPVTYEVNRFDTYSLNLDASLEGGATNPEYKTDKNISANAYVRNLGSFCLSDGILVYNIVKGRNLASTTLVDRELEDRENIFEEGGQRFSVCPGELKTIPLSISLPRDLSSGQYRIDLYVASPRMSLKGNPEIYRAGASLPFRINASTGLFPEAAIVHSKTTFAGGRQQVGPIVTANGSQSGNIAFINNSGDLFEGKVGIKTCVFGEASGLGCQMVGEYPVHIEPNKESSVTFKLSTKMKPDVYSIVYELSELSGRIVSIYKNRFIISGHEAGLRSLSADRYEYKKGDKINLQLGINGPYRYSTASGETKNVDLKVSLYDTSGIFEKRIYSKTQNYPSVGGDSEAPFWDSLVAGRDITSYRLCGDVSVDGKEVDSRCITSGESAVYLPWPANYFFVIVLILLIARLLFKFKNKSHLIIAGGLLIGGLIFSSGVNAATFYNYLLIPSHGQIPYPDPRAGLERIQRISVDSGGDNCAEVQFYNDKNNDGVPQVSERTRLLVGKYLGDPSEATYYVPKGTIAYAYRPLLDDPTAMDRRSGTRDTTINLNGSVHQFHEVYDLDIPQPPYEACATAHVNDVQICGNGSTNITNQVGKFYDYRMNVLNNGTLEFLESTSNVVSVTPSALIAAINNNTYTDQSFAVHTTIFPGPDTNDIPDLTEVNSTGNIDLLYSYFGQSDTNIQPAGQIFQNYQNRCVATNPQVNSDSAHFASQKNMELIQPETASLFGAINSLFEIPVANAATSCITPTTGLVSWWRAEANANDATSTNNGVMSNGATFAAGNTGQAFSLDGNNTAGQGDYVAMTNATNLQIPNATTGGTVEAWIKTANAGTGYRGIIVKQFAYGLYLFDNVLVVYDFGPPAGPAGGQKTTGVNLANNAWHHVALTFQPGTSNNAASMYIDGVNRLNFTLSAKDQTARLVVGSGVPDGSLQNFAGLIDEPAVYNRALTATEIQNIFNAGTFGKCIPLIITNSTTLSAATVGTATTDTLTSTGGDGAYTYTLRSGSTLPAGLTLSSAGVISGTPTVSGVYTFTVQVTDSATPVAGVAFKTFTKTVLANSCLAPATGLISWWTGDTNASDFQGANNGTLTSGATANNAGGKIGNSFSFDGVDDYVTIPANTGSLNLTGSTVTIEGWIKPTAASPQTSAMLFGKTVSGGNDYMLYINGSFVSAIVKAGGVETPLATAVIPPLNQYTHVALTYDGANIRIYVNGVQSASAVKTGVLAGSNAPFNIGGRPASNLPFKGQIDEVSVYNRALSIGEIQSIFTADAFGKCKTLSISTASLPDSMATLPLSPNDQLSTTGGTAPITYTIQSGALPTGLTMSSAGLISGTPTVAGTYNFTVLVTDSLGATATKSLSKNIIPAPICTAPPSGNLGWWQAEGSPNDTTLNANNGVVNGGVTYVSGKVGQAFNFNGSTGYVSVPSATGNFNPAGAPSSAVTIEGWVKPNTAITSGTNAILFGKTVAAGNDYLVIIESGVLKAYIKAGGVESSTNFGIVSLASLPTTSFTHVALVYDSVTSAIKMYVNGAQFGSTVAKSGSLAGSNAPLDIGGRSGGLYFNGIIDEVGVYNTALSLTQIQSIYNSDFAGKCSGPTVPGTPGTPTALPGNGQVSITGWTTVAGATGYRLYDSTNLVTPIVPDIVGAPSFPIFVSPLTNGTNYTFKVSAYNAQGEGSKSNPSNVATPQFPPNSPAAAPTGTVGPTQVNLSWSAPSSDATHGPATGYYAYFSTDGTNYTKFATQFSSASGSVTGLTTGTPYTFKITATNVGGESLLSSSPASAQIIPTDPCNSSTPISFGQTINGTLTSASCASSPYYGTRHSDAYTFTAEGNQQVTITGTVPGSSPYIYWYIASCAWPTGGSCPSPWPINASQSSGPASVTYTTLASPSPNTHKIIVSTWSGSDLGNYTITLTIPKPAAPTNVTGFPGNAQASLSWTAPTGSVTGYKIFSNNINSTTGVADITPSCAINVAGASAVCTGLTNNQDYYFFIKASNSAGDSVSYSTGSNKVTPTPPVPPPSAPTDLSASSNNASVSLTWTAPATGGEPDGYNIYYKLESDPNTSYVKFNSIPVLTTSSTVTGLTNNTNYSFEVSAVNSGGESSMSAPVTSTPSAAPSAVPTGISVTPGDASATVAWNNSTPTGVVTGYRIYKSTSNNGPFTLAADVTGSPEVVTGLTNNVFWYFKVSAYNNAGEGPQSAYFFTKPFVPCTVLPTDTSSTAQTIVYANGKEYHIDMDGIKQYLWLNGYIKTSSFSAVTSTAGPQSFLAKDAVIYKFNQTGKYIIGMNIYKTYTGSPPASIFSNRKPQ